MLQLTEEDEDVDAAGTGSKFLLKDLKTGQKTEFRKLPGFDGARRMCENRSKPGSYFWMDGSYRLAFFAYRVGTPNGDACVVLDLAKRRLITLDQSWTTPYPLPGEHAFLTVTSEFFVPIAGTKRQEHSVYIDHWDASFKRTRYARDEAGICYGASIYRPGKTPAVITIRSEEENSVAR